MNLKDRKKLAYQLAVRVWGKQPAPARLGKARRMIEELWEDDELVASISGIHAAAHVAIIYDKAVRRLSETLN